MKTRGTGLTGLLILLSACSSPPPEASEPDRVLAASLDTNEDNPFGFPALRSYAIHVQVRKRIGYTTAVEETWKIPAWVSYRLLKEYFDPGAPDFPRLSRFITDTSLPQALQVTHDHYTGTGYDRGHMAPHASMQGRTQECVRESYFLSNISPQTPALNRTIWKNLEEKERDWTRKFGTVWIITGPIFEHGQVTERMSPSNSALSDQVAIPSRFFKILIRRESETLHAIAFVMPNRKEAFVDDRDFAPWQVRIDDVESAAGLDFLGNLPDDVENSIESSMESIWN
jgi:endonuclease G